LLTGIHAVMQQGSSRNVQTSGKSWWKRERREGTYHCAFVLGKKSW
jgi:hypothetical protein